MFDFGNANEKQREAIQTTEGPLLLIAGPGTGKTFTLVQRAVYLILEKKVSPSEILIATFTEKAAKELVTRITDELAKRNISVNLNEMYVGTFHSICLRILKENLEHTRIKKNFRVIDQFDQQYTVFRNIWKFEHIPDYSLAISQKSKWRQAAKICYYVNTLSEELVDYKEMQTDSSKSVAALGHILEKYNQILEEENYLDFSAIQVETYNLLQNNPDILEELQNKLKYIMIDEYQDTNYIQEELVFLLAGTLQNVCVVGDDDQGLYRFRGATIRNILEFPKNFPEGKCSIIHLTTNYRSDKQIVQFYNHWMRDTETGEFSWEGKYRFDKEIVSHNTTENPSPTVIRVTGYNSSDTAWCEKVLEFILTLKESGKLTDYNQIAFLFKSVKNPRVERLSSELEEHGISVYSPRSNMFFSRPEIMAVVGCLLLLFPEHLSFLDENSAKEAKTYFFKKSAGYYIDCLQYAKNIITENPSLRKWVQERGVYHHQVAASHGKINTDYAFSGLFYQLLSFSPFKEYLDTDLDKGVIDLRPQRNLALFSNLLNKYEYLQNLSLFTAKDLGKNVVNLFNLYLRLLFEEGIPEYEDESEYAPSGCVSFLTIHQSKGMEFPIVFVDVGDSAPRKQSDDLVTEIEKTYFHRDPFEPVDKIKYFDFWRLYYTAFSRAQNLLVLTTRGADPGKHRPYYAMEELYYDETPEWEVIYDEEVKKECDESLEEDEEAPVWADWDFDFNDFDFATVKDVNLKQTYSFTSHILFYDICPTQYKFFKELEFTPSRIGSTIFGRVVHETIEDIHHAAIRGDVSAINPENIESWLRINYSAISQRDHLYLGEKQIASALDHVMNYVEYESKEHPDWAHIRETEVDVGLVKENYILEGKIDLISGEDGTVDIVDFKSEKKPDMFKDRERIALYKKQLQIYAHLVEERTGQKVNEMRLFYTGAKDEVPTISFKRNQSSIDETVKEFGDIVGKIQKKDFHIKANSPRICKECDFRHYCNK